MTLGFDYPWFLLGLSLLALPILLHLMNRQMPRRLVFPSTRFLRRAELPPEGRRRLRDLLLLLVRLLALAAAVLAFARPWLTRPPDGAGAAAAGDGTTVLLVDRSSSLSARGANERVLAIARSELAGLRPSARAALVLSADRVLAALPPGSAHQAIMETLEDTPPQPLAGDHAAGLRQAARYLEGPGARRLVVLSDLQSPDWQRVREGLPSGVEVRLATVSEAIPANVAIIAASATPVSAERCRVVVEVRSFSERVEERTLTVRLGAEQASVTLSLPPLQVRRAALALPRLESVQGIAELSADDYAADDVLHFWAAAPPPVPVVAVVPAAEDDAEASPQAFFLSKALQNRGAGSTAFALQTVAADALFVTDLSQVPVLFVLGAAERLDEAGVERLAGFCREGGTAVVTPGAFPAQMIHGLRAGGLGDIRLLEWVGQNRRRGESWTLGWLDPKGLLGDAFAPVASTDLFLFPIRQYLRLEAPAAAVHLRTASGDPVLLEQPLGRGRVLLLALPFDTAWSDLPLTASFLPMVQELARSAVPAGHGITRLECGQALPEFRDLLGRPAVTGTASAPPSTDRPGVFAVGDHPVEVNISRRESSPERINPYDLRRRLQAEAGPSLAAPALATPHERRALWPVLALAAAGLLLLELAWTLATDRQEIRRRVPAGP